MPSIKGYENLLKENMRQQLMAEIQKIKRREALKRIKKELLEKEVEEEVKRIKELLGLKEEKKEVKKQSYFDILKEKILRCFPF